MDHRNSSLVIMLFIGAFFRSLAKVEHISFDLIHRDSFHSPFYNPSISSSQFFARDVRRSRARVDRLNLSSNYTHEKAVYVDGELIDDGNNYLISFSIGSKRVRVYAFFDITTDFIFTRCNGPLFVYQESTTHVVILSNHKLCKLIRFRKRTKLVTDCRYENYVTKMGLSTSGFVIEDDFFFHSNQERGSRLFFGCADSGLASEDQLGVLGFGKGKLSVPHQIKNRMKYDQYSKFSYCLQSPAESTSSMLKLGGLPPWLDELMVPSPLQRNPSDPSSYYLNLKRINIGGTDHWIPKSSRLIKIDSGTSMTFLENNIFEEVKDIVTKIIRKTPRSPSEYGLCYITDDLGDINLPSMVFHFDQASFHIQSESLFIRNKGETCMSILSVVGVGSSIFGSIAQENHVMQFDFKKEEVKFTSHPLDCKSFSVFRYDKGQH